MKDVADKELHESKFLRREFIKYSMMKIWMKTTRIQHLKQMGERQLEINYQKTIMAANKDKIDTLYKYKDDMDRDVAIKGEMLIKREMSIQKLTNRVSKFEAYIKVLEEKLSRLPSVHKWS